MIDLQIKRYYYYKVAVLGRKLHPLTYAFSEPLVIGSVVEVSLQNRIVSGVVVDSSKEGEFKTLFIDRVKESIFKPYQLSIARFISEYYACSLAEALSLFEPFKTDETKQFRPDIKEPKIVLTSAQRKAYDFCLAKESALLFAPTGSGKTEIYMKLFAKMLKEQKSSIFLMPEISLTPQMEKRLKVHFGDLVAIWHSKLTKKRREETLKGIREGRVKIVAGPRSALFLPLEDIGLIVVDEEHDDSYKAHNRPRYHARDLALYMGKVLGAKVVLGSATPSASTYARQPVVRIEEPFVKTKKRFIFERGGCSLTPSMREAIKRHLDADGQVLVFLPTRGNFKYLYCDSCGYRVECPFCSVGMSLHRSRRMVRCHYCGYAEKIPQKCPKCGYHISSERIGTSEVVEELEREFGGVKVQQFDKDTITTARKLQKALDSFAKRETNILVGTQMLAKGHDYPDITLAIILGLDYILALPDYRARERAQSLFVQIAGRAGRFKEAEVIVQTNDVEFFSEYIGNYERFLREEISQREGLYPPFTHLCRLLFSSKNEKRAEDNMNKVREKIESFAKVEVVGADKAPIEKIAGKYRYNILLRSEKRADLLRVVKGVNDGSYEVDMDPVDFA